ncbi:MAG: hypothetical protein EA360_02890 [Balneolaceae bacterium]|nr:MAG: hypothetical protein EA360_02890 [Balneolaceae bacterium]
MGSDYGSDDEIIINPLMIENRIGSDSWYFRQFIADYLLVSKRSFQQSTASSASCSRPLFSLSLQHGFLIWKLT